MLASFQAANAWPTSANTRGCHTRAKTDAVLASRRFARSIIQVATRYHRGTNTSPNTSVTPIPLHCILLPRSSQLGFECCIHASTLQFLHTWTRTPSAMPIGITTQGIRYLRVFTYLDSMVGSTMSLRKMEMGSEVHTELFPMRIHPNSITGKKCLPVCPFDYMSVYLFMRPL